MSEESAAGASGVEANWLGNSWIGAAAGRQTAATTLYSIVESPPTSTAGSVLKELSEHMPGYHDSWLAANKMSL